MENKNEKDTIDLTPEQFKLLEERNERQRKRDEYVLKRKNEINFNEGIKADGRDLLGIYNMQFQLNMVNFVGNTLQNIQNIFNNIFVKTKEDFWYKNIFKKYDIPKELPLTYVKGTDGRYKFIIPEENDGQE